MKRKQTQISFRSSFPLRRLEHISMLNERRILALILFSLSALVSLFLLQTFHASSASRSTVLNTFTLKESLTIRPMTPAEDRLGPEYETADTIPNRVHFIYILPTENAATLPLQFTFQDFLAVYAAYYHLRPTEILLHTNAQTLPEDTTQATYTSASSFWTHRILNVPGVRLVSTQPVDGLNITHTEHHTDFLRTRLLHRYGGIYLDFDAYVLRDLRPLRKSGFQNVLALQVDHRVACGMMMAAQQSELMRVYSQKQVEWYDGKWDTHAVKLLDWLVRSQGDRRVLVLSRDAFFPLGWRQRELREIYVAEHRQQKEVAEVVRKGRDQQLGMEYFDCARPFPGAWAMHGFRSAARRFQLASETEWPVVDVEYILDRRTRFACAMYPMVKDVVERGLLLPFQFKE